MREATCATDMQRVLQRWAENVVRVKSEQLRLLIDADAAEACGVSPDWLRWHRRENRMGATGLTAVIGDRRMPVASLEDLARVFEEMAR